MYSIKILQKSVVLWLLFATIACDPDQGPAEKKEPVNIAPTCTVSANPVSGTVPLTVSFSGSGSDTDGTIVKYEWDYEGDGTFDFSSATSATTVFTYTKVGNYNATLRVTDDKGDTGNNSQRIEVKEITYVYPGFKDLSFAVGKYWKYKWTYDNTVNGSKKPQLSGFVTITLTEKVTVSLTSIGDLDLYKTEYVKTGDKYPLVWDIRPYLATKQGVIYIAETQNSQWTITELLNSQTGKFYGKEGFIGYFSPSRTETLAVSAITNEFNSAYSSQGVVVSEPYYKPQCETIGGVQICDDTFHNYQVKEYYLDEIGFGGFTRAGTSIYSGGGYTDMFSTSMKVWLVDTSINK